MKNKKSFLEASQNLEAAWNNFVLEFARAIGIPWILDRLTGLINRIHRPKYYFWHNVIDSTDPVPAGQSGIIVNTKIGDTAEKAAQATEAAINVNKMDDEPY